MMEVCLLITFQVVSAVVIAFCDIEWQALIGGVLTSLVSSYRKL